MIMANRNVAKMEQVRDEIYAQDEMENYKHCATSTHRIKLLKCDLNDLS